MMSARGPYYVRPSQLHEVYYRYVRTTGTGLSVLYYGTETYPFCIRVQAPYYTYGCTAAREAKQGSQLRDKDSTRHVHAW